LYKINHSKVGEATETSEITEEVDFKVEEPHLVEEVEASIHHHRLRVFIHLIITFEMVEAGNRCPGTFTIINFRVEPLGEEVTVQIKDSSGHVLIMWIVLKAFRPHHRLHHHDEQ